MEGPNIQAGNLGHKEIAPVEMTERNNCQETIVHPLKLTWKLQKWRFASDDFPEPC